MQGLQKNLFHYEHAAVSMSEERLWRPVVVASISRLQCDKTSASFKDEKPVCSLEDVVRGGLGARIEKITQ